MERVTASPTGARRVDKRGKLLVPERNCWRVERARRVSWLVDGTDYFSAVRSSPRVQLNAYILSWDFAFLFALEREWLTCP